jgi:hypothetical protein
VPGFDLTFKAPKSASVLYAVSDDPRVQGAVIEAREAATRAALGWLERDAIEAQRGSHNVTWLAAHVGEPGVGPRRVATSGVVAASFRHRTSCAGDPLLNWHVLVANLVERTDRKWSAFAHPDLYRHRPRCRRGVPGRVPRPAGRGVGRGVAPGAPRRRDRRDPPGDPGPVLEAFDGDRRLVDGDGDADSREGRQAAVLATCRHKPEVEGGRFDEAWKAEAQAAGWGPDTAERLVGWSMQRAEDTIEGCWRLNDVVFDEDGRAGHVERLVEVDEWIADLPRRELTATTSTFTEADLIRAVAARQGAAVETIDRIADRVLASNLVVALTAADGEPPRWTSRELVDVEARFLTWVNAPPSHDPLPAIAVERAFAGRPSLGEDQLANLRTLSDDRHPVAVLVGAGGHR